MVCRRWVPKIETVINLRHRVRTVGGLDGPAFSGGTLSTVRSGTSPWRSPTASRLATFIPWLFRLSVGFGLLEALAAAAARQPAFVAAAALTTGFSVVVLVASRLIGGGRDIHATRLLAVSLGVIGLLGTLIVPGIGEAMALLPVLAVALLMPYANGRYRRTIVALALGWTVLVLVGTDLGRWGSGSEPLGDLFAQAILVGIVGLVIAALVDFSDHAVRSLQALETSVAFGRVLSPDPPNRVV